MYNFKGEDLALFLTLMGPDHVIPAALEYGGGCAITGAPEAYAEIRGQMREYVKYIRWRDKVTIADLELALAFRSLGFIPSVHNHVQPLLPSDWRETAAIFWRDQQGLIPGIITVDVGSASQKTIDAACIVAISDMLRDVPEVNMAFLQGNAWGRTSFELMIPRNIRGEVKVITLDAAGRDVKWVKDKMRKGLRKIIAMERSDNPVVRLGTELLKRWAESGFVTSSAGAMVSLVGASGVEEGQSALVRSNGVPLAFTIPKPVNGHIRMGMNIDHRCIDGDQSGKMTRYLQERIPEVLRGEYEESTNNRRNKGTGAGDTWKSFSFELGGGGPEQIFSD